MSYIGNEPVVSATRTITEITATAGQTVFNANGGYTVGYIDVVVNGAFLQASDFTATNGTSVTLNTACVAWDDVKLIAWGTFTASSSYTQAQIDSKIGASQFGFKNRIINGDMRIDQRNAGASVTPSATDAATYLLDRFYLRHSVGSKLSVQRSSDAPSGFKNSTLITSLSSYSVGTNEHFEYYQGIEGFNIADFGWGTSSAKTVTLSFWVKSSLTGTFGIGICNGPAARSFLTTYTITAANTWQYVTVQIPGDTAGTWPTDNSAGMFVGFCLGAGSGVSNSASSSWYNSFYRSPTGATSVVGTNGATFQITGVQLEVGTVATSFDYRPYGTELALCQRYFEKSYNIDVTVGGGSVAAGLVDATTTSNSGGNAYVPIIFKVTKRAAPSMTGYQYSGGTAGVWSYDRSGTPGNPSVTFGTIGMNSVSAVVPVGANNAAVEVYGHWTATSEL